MCTIIVFATLDELRVLGPLWLREQLKRRRPGRGPAQVLGFERVAAHQEAARSAGGGES